MGLCASGDLIQDKSDELPGDIEGSNMHIDDIIVIGKEVSSRHIYQLRVIFAMIIVAGIKFNALK